MKKLTEEIRLFLRTKAYVLALSLIACCSYGFAVAQPAVGTDDTAIALYFEEGLAPYVGRWTLYGINRIFRINDFAPWMIELVSVILFMLSVTLWCVLFRRVCQKAVQLPIWSYLFVAGIFISCPLISEVYVFYLHNGICIGYGIVALALLFLLESVSIKCSMKRRALFVLMSSFLLTAATGCYESFIIVYAMGAVMLFFLLRQLYGKKKEASEYKSGVLVWIVNCGIAGAVSLILRSVILAVIKAAAGLSRFEDFGGAFYRGLFTSMDTELADIIMTIKRYWMKYFVNGVVYLPIAVLAVAFVVIGLFSLYYGVKKRDIMLPVCAAGILVLPIAMCIIEGITTRYRTAQFVPVVGAFAVLLILLELDMRKVKSWVKWCCCFLLSALLFNQCADMNRWFYVDYKKYQNAKEVAQRIAYDLERSCNIEKPLVFCGTYEVPSAIKQDAYCGLETKEFQWISRISDVVDPHLKEKYYDEDGRGYVFAETPILSTIDWATIAFNGTPEQLIAFMEMHGSSFSYTTDSEVIDRANKTCEETGMPGYPQSGYIRELEDCIIVNLEYNK